MCGIIIKNLIKEDLKMKNGWYLAAILSVISILIQFYKLINLKGSIDFIDILLGILTGIGSCIKIKDNKDKQ